MPLLDLFLISVRTLAKHVLRSGLTVLGVVIGIASVTTMISIGLGAGELVRSQVEGLGANLILVFPKNAEREGAAQGKVITLTAADGAALVEDCPDVVAVCPTVGAGGQVIGGISNCRPGEMLGVGPDYVSVLNWPIRAGRFITDGDVSTAAKVCVIGLTVARKLFPNADPLGETVRVRNVPLVVVGVLARKGANMVGQDRDDILVMPFTTARKRLEGSAFANVDVLLVSARTQTVSARAQRQIAAVLRERHKIPADGRPDFDIGSTAEIAGVLSVVTGSLTAMMAATAAISLVVGGVGIMNIMLVSVTERTKEIGLRMALGARPRDILRQFLVESIVLSTIGGVFGLALGVVAAYGLTVLINSVLPSANWPFIVSVPGAVIAIIFAAGVGVFFGYYPAFRASRLDPIEALRYE